MTQRALVCTCTAAFVCTAHTEAQAKAMSQPWEKAHRKLGHRPQVATPEIVAPVVAVPQPREGA